MQALHRGIEFAQGREREAEIAVRLGVVRLTVTARCRLSTASCRFP